MLDKGVSGRFLFGENLWTWTEGGHRGAVFFVRLESVDLRVEVNGDETCLGWSSLQRRDGEGSRRSGWRRIFYAGQFVLLLEVVPHFRGVDSAKVAAGHVVLEEIGTPLWRVGATSALGTSEWQAGRCHLERHAAG